MVISFLPFEDFEESAKVLDNSRLGKMRSENYIILNRILNYDKINGGGWIHHPMTLSWLGYPTALKFYLNCVISEWEGRGFSNSYEEYLLPEEIEFPPFVGLREFHFSHQASLVRKHPYYYSTSFPNLPSDYLSLGYLWPSSLTEEKILSLKEEGNYLHPDKTLFSEVNTSFLLSQSKSEERMYSLSSLKKIAKENNIDKKIKTKKELFPLLKKLELLK